MKSLDVTMCYSPQLKDDVKPPVTTRSLQLEWRARLDHDRPYARGSQALDGTSYIAPYGEAVDRGYWALNLKVFWDTLRTYPSRGLSRLHLSWMSAVGKSQKAIVILSTSLTALST